MAVRGLAVPPPALDRHAMIESWPNLPAPTSANPAARPPPNGRASARPAAAGTPSPRKAPPRPSGQARPAEQKAANYALEDLKTEDAPPQRRLTGIAEFDRVTGGGLVPGSAASGRRRSGHRQIHHHPAGPGQVCEEWRPRDLHLRRGGDGAGAHARRPHGAVAKRR